jgi:hypothetical protein
MAITRQRSGDGSLGWNGGVMFLGCAVDTGGKAVPPKLPESLDLDFGEVCVFLPKEHSGGGEDVHEVVKVGCGHIEFQMFVSTARSLGSPVQSVNEYKAEIA